MKDDFLQKVKSMASETIARDLLKALLDEIQIMPDIWVKLPKARQEDVIERLRKRVDSNVRMAVHIIASDNRTVVVGDIDQITIKDGVKAVIKFSSDQPHLHDLFDSSGKAVIVAVASHAEYTKGLDEVHGEDDQRAMDLGHEYDPNADGQDMARDIVDAEVTPYPSLPEPDEHTEEELKDAYNAGYQAAKDGLPQSACELVPYQLVKEWMSGYASYEAEPDSDDSQKELGDIE